MTTSDQDIKLLRDSDLFDPTWYGITYPDVAVVGMDPVEHYVRYGARLLRDPGPRFSTRQYLEDHPEVAAGGINPLVHYVRRGKPEAAKEPAVRIPAPQQATSLKGFFDKLDDTGMTGWAIDASRPGAAVSLTVFVDGVRLMDIVTAQTRNDLTSKGMNGEVAGFTIPFPIDLFPSGASIDIRFAKTGVSLSRSPRTVESAPATPVLFSEYLEAYRAGNMLPVTVIVPIFNAHDAVAECLEALESTSLPDADVLMLDDCSTDSRIPALLQRFARKPRFRAHRNDTNLGYTRSVNKGIGLCPGRDVLLLNSDTVATGRWLQNMRYGAYALPRVATVTALSDNAGAFSVPEMGAANGQPGHLSRESFGLAVVQAGRGRLLEVPTGNGFCMYIRRAALDAVGMFDEKKFPRGYGEENDLSMRALRRGWKNVVCDKAMVLHKRSQSFQGEKAALVEAGSRQILADYPEYKLLTQRFKDAEFSMLRQGIRQAVSDGRRPRPRLLFVISTQTGGTPQTNLDLMRAVSAHYEGFLLRCDASTVTFSRLVDDELQPVETHRLSRSIEPVTHRSDEYDRYVLDLLYRHAIDLLHVRHVAWHSLGLAECAQSLGIPIVYSLHDFYSLCPSLNLLDEKLTHCGGKCTPGAGECQASLWPKASLPVIKHGFVARWHEMFGDFIASCDHVVTTSPSAAATASGVYPGLQDKLTVIPHGRDFGELSAIARRPARDEKIRVLVPGNISVIKGALLLKAMSELAEASRFEFHFLGVTASQLAGIGIQHGKYDRSNFGDKVRSIAPHIGVVLSICAETYCHTLTEMWSCGVPVLGIDLGSVGDRIRSSGAGWLVEPGAAPAEVLRHLTAAVDDGPGYQKRLEATRHWQESECIWNDTAAMAVEYRRIYHRLIHGRDATPLQRVVLVGDVDMDRVMARMPQRFPASAQCIAARTVSCEWLVAGGTSRVDFVVVQGRGIPAAQLDELIDRLKGADVPFAFDMDEPNAGRQAGVHSAAT